MSALGWSLPAGCGTLPGEEEGAYEEKIDGIWYAWDESDNIYKHTGDCSERDDGYAFVGKLEFDDGFDEPLAQFRHFVKGLTK